MIPFLQSHSGLTSRVSTIFANGEPGVWYDPSDLSTMYQDAAGTTPVTAVEQPVGLMLDKSKGLVVTQLITNGSFNTSIDGWSTVSPATASWTSAGIQVSRNGTSFQNQAATPISLVAGNTYFVSVDVSVGPTSAYGGLEIWNADRTTALYLVGNFRRNAAGNLATSFVATRTENALVVVGISGATAGTVTFDNISVREIPGNHARQTTATSRPVLSARVNLLTKADDLTDAAWTKQSGTSVNVMPVPDPNGALTAWFVVGNGGNGIFQAVPGTTRLGQTTRSVYMRTRSGAATVLLKDPAQTQGSVTCNLTTTWQRFTLTETTTPAAGFSAGIWIDDIPATGIEIAQPDLRVANAGVDLPPYQRVNTSTDYDTAGFPHYLRFDGVDDWLVTPTITPGTDKVQVFAGVRKLSDAAVGFITELSVNSTSNTGAFWLAAPINTGASGDYGFRVQGTGGAAATGAPNVIALAPISNVVTGIGDISASLVQIRLNGTVKQTLGLSLGTGNFLAYPLYIGRRAGTSLPFNGHLYSLIVRFGSNLPIATIVNTENYVNGLTKAY